MGDPEQPGRPPATGDEEVDATLREVHASLGRHGGSPQGDPGPDDTDPDAPGPDDTESPTDVDTSTRADAEVDALTRAHRRLQARLTAPAEASPASGSPQAHPDPR